MSFVIKTATGRYIVNDERMLTLSACWHESIESLFTDTTADAATRAAVMEQARPEIEREGYDYLYEELLPPILAHDDFPLPKAMQGLRTRLIYFARPGLYHFIPNKR